MERPRQIAVVTTSRADYGHLIPVLRKLDQHPAVDMRLIAIGAQLAPEFGRAVDEVGADGFRVDERIECLLSSDTDVGMAKTIGVAMLGLAEVLGRMRPDLLLLIADRYEMLAPASTALALRIPIAHIEGGEISQGAVDDAVRNALTKLSHLHFTPTARARERVLSFGEEPWRVHQSGAPSLDLLAQDEPLGRDVIEQELGLDCSGDLTVVAYHPVTLAQDTLREADVVFDALEALAGRGDSMAFCFPNADAGSRALIERAKAFCDRHPNAHLFINLHPRRYWELLRHASLVIGNSSSGIMETPSLALPTVNVGLRQFGRERAANVVDAEPQESPTTAGILTAVDRARSPTFRDSLRGMQNPYGDGRAADRIVEVLLETPLGEALLRKQT